MYTIYHIPEKKKVGCTQNLERRMKQLKATEFEVLEVYDSLSEATRREIELQLEMYGVRDNTLGYEDSLKMKSYPAIQKWKQTVKESKVWKEAQEKKLSMLKSPEVRAIAHKARMESKAWNDAKKVRAAKLKDPETRAKAKASIIKKYGSITGAMLTPEAIAKRKVPVIQYDKQGNFIREWLSSKDAAIGLGLHSSGITMCAKRTQKTCGGFIWKYKNETVN